MNKEKKVRQVQDYRKFLAELKAQFRAVSVLERQFYELDDLCEYAIKNDVTVLDDSGVRVSVVDDCLAKEQLDVYQKLHKAVEDLGGMLADGEGCFTKTEGN